MKNAMLLVWSFLFLTHCGNNASKDAFPMNESMETEMEPPRTAEPSAQSMEADFYQETGEEGSTQRQSGAGGTNESIQKLSS